MNAMEWQETNFRKLSAHQERRGFRHVPRGTGWAQAPFLAGEGDDRVVSAVGTPDAREAVGQDAAFKVAIEGVLHVAGETTSLPGAGVGTIEEGVEVLPDDLVERRLLRLMAAEILRDIPGQGALLHALRRANTVPRFIFSRNSL